ncbi:MAG: glycosyltransferase family 87 protein [Anaerolineae bacterium]
MIRQALFVSALLLVLYVVLAYAFYAGVASRAPGANDYYSRWMGARALFLRGADPYSDAVTREIQMGMYGRLARPDEDQVAFAYPLYAAFFTLPLITLPYAWAESFWIALLMMLVGSAGVFLARSFRWLPKPLGLLGLLGFMLAFYPDLRGLFLGQYTLILFASLAGALILIASGRDGWAGIVLAASSVKPHVAMLAVIVVLSWGLWHRRWRLLGGWAAAMTALVVPALILLPAWPLEFLGALGRYQSYITIGPPLQVWCELLLPPTLSGPVTGLLTVILVAVLVYQWARTVRQDWNAFLPTVEFAMLVTTMAMVRTATTDQTMLLVLWIHWLSRLVQTRRARWAVLIALAVVAVPWIIFLTTLNGNLEAPVATTGAMTLTLIGYLVVHARSGFAGLYADLCHLKLFKSV